MQLRTWRQVRPKGSLSVPFFVSAPVRGICIVPMDMHDNEHERHIHGWPDVRAAGRREESLRAVGVRAGRSGETGPTKEGRNFQGRETVLFLAFRQATSTDACAGAVCGGGREGGVVHALDALKTGWRSDQARASAGNFGKTRVTPASERVHWRVVAVQFDARLGDPRSRGITRGQRAPVVTRRTRGRAARWSGAVTR